MKMIVFFRRRAGLNAEQFRDYYENHHAPLAVRLFPYMKDYRRNYIRHDQRHQRAGGEAVGTNLDFDVITEISFAGVQDYQRMKDDMTNPDIRRQVVEDEQRFLDRAATVVLLVDEQGGPLDRLRL